MTADDAAAPVLAVVTGGGSGIGGACAEQLGARGFTVLCVGRTAKTLDEVVATVAAAGGTAEAVEADCATADGVATIAAAVGDRPVAALIHAAGRDLARGFAETTAADLEALLAVNLGAPFFLTQALVPTLADGAGVVFVGSVSATAGRNRHAAYGASKAALIGLVANLAVELAPRIRVNCVSPGATRTGMLAEFVAESTKGLSDDEQRRLRTSDRARILLARIAEPAEVAASIVHLAVDATAVTGVDLPVDVGYTVS